MNNPVQTAEFFEVAFLFSVPLHSQLRNKMFY